MTHRTHALRPGAQWLRSPAVPLSLRPLTVAVVLAAVALVAVVVAAVGLFGQSWIATARDAGSRAPAVGAAQGLGEAVGIEELAWIAGKWRSEQDGQLIEERWEAPLGDSMTGSMRWLRGGRGHLYEHMLIEESGDTLRFSLRHFNPGSVAWEDKDAPMRYELVELGEDEVVFGSEHEFPARFTFRRDGADGLTILLEGRRDGEPLTIPFDYHRAKD